MRCPCMLCFVMRRPVCWSWFFELHCTRRLLRFVNDCNKDDYYYYYYYYDYVSICYRFDFQREIATLRCLNDPNVVRLLGLVVGGHHRGDPSACIVTEYMQHGDLKQYLQRHRAQEFTTLARGSSAASLAGASTLRSVVVLNNSIQYSTI